MLFRRDSRLGLVVGAAIIAGSMISAAPAAADSVATPTPEAADSGELSAISCPVAGESSFFNDWGDPRSGGRRHQGVDMVADRGTPIVAALAGSAEFKNSHSGGKSVWLTTAAGNKFFYAHLEDWAGESREVAQGEVIGYVGSSGNAGGSHLHFEVHPGGTPQNPFPFTDRACSVPVETPVETSMHAARSWR